MEYQIVRGASLDELEERTRLALVDGWRVAGGAGAVADPGTFGSTFFQSLVKGPLPPKSSVEGVVSSKSHPKSS